jgi:hypothetical protein
VGAVPPSLAGIKDLVDERPEVPRFAGRVLAAAAYVNEVRGDSSAATDVINRLRTAESPLHSASWAPWVARVFSRRSNFKEARALLVEASRDAAEPQNRGLMFEALCDVIAAEGAFEDADDLVGAARRHAEEAKLVALPLFAERLAGRAAAARGDLPAATDVFRRTAEGFRRLEARWEAAFTELLLARTLLEAGQSLEAESLLDAVLPVFDEVGSAREAADARALIQK